VILVAVGRAAMDSANVGRTMLTLLALSVAMPLNVAVVAACLVYRGVRRASGSDRGRMTSSDPKTVLVSGGKMTKALQLARSFHQAGHRVVLVESDRYWFAAHRFSRAVDRFHTLPAPEHPAYVDALMDVVEREGVDVYVPVTSPVGSLCDSRAMPRLATRCEVVHVGPDLIERLDDKHVFATTATGMGLSAPKSVLVTDPADVLGFDFSGEPRQFILKSIRYDSIRRLDLTRLPCPTPAEMEAFVRSLPISPENPWVMQEFIPGTEYCTHGTFRDGRLTVHCCCASSAFQINYAHVEKPVIEDWVRRFGADLGLTGQASFDFIEADDDGRTYAIECNPRTHSAITMLYNHPGLADAYLRDFGEATVRPTATSRPTYWLYHEVWRLFCALGSPAKAIERLRVIARGKDAVLDWRDPLPFLMLHHWHVPILLLRDLRERRGWFRIDFNIGKLVQLGGD
jgi:predicted ATP-grasp superfamily ATP-dependent carboligase